MPVIRTPRLIEALVVDGLTDDAALSSLRWLLACGHLEDIALREGVNIVQIPSMVHCHACAAMKAASAAGPLPADGFRFRENKITTRE